MTKLRDFAKGQSCVACGTEDGTVVLAHYFGPRRGQYGGGLSIKGHDLVGAHLCAECHKDFDTNMRDKDQRWLLSEEFLHMCMKTILRLASQGKLKW